jgi:hypothetical protein
VKPWLALLAFVVLTVPEPARPACSPPVDRRAAAQVERALRAKRDVWGEELLATAAGPTFDGVRRYLPPLLYARAAKQTRLTESGVHYVAFSHPAGPQGAGSVVLHVADGSQLISQRADGHRLTVRVGAGGGERYGKCLVRLTMPRLRGGWLPVLQTRYVDALGVRYRQESFAAPLGQARLAGLVQLVIDARGASGRATVRFESSRSGLTFSVRPGGMRTVFVAWPVGATAGRPRLIGRRVYAGVREAQVRYWERRLAEGTMLEVPERRVMDAQRAILVQNLGLTWRYSVGNAYEQFSSPEAVDVAQVTSSYGHDAVARSILRTSLTRRTRPYPNWKMGQKLVGSALHYRLVRDRRFVAEVTPALRGYVAELGRQLEASERGILQRERFSSDISDSVYGLHSQAVAWQGLRWMGVVWAETGDEALAATCRRLAERLGRGLRSAVRESQVRLADGSLFLPSRLLDRERPYDDLTASRAGSYWNLVVPYALASGLFAPGSPELKGALRYLRLHGSRFLGLVRAGAYALYGHHAPYPTSGTDQVYGLNVARFLAAVDEPDELVLSLYGQLAAAMTPGTFVAGEAASLTPIRGEHHRAMYLPPNGASNATFLGTLRLLLVNETLDSSGAPAGLELAHATPRAWLEPGKRIVVRAAPTSFGPLSYSLRATQTAINTSIDVPARAPRDLRLRLRLRLPRGSRVTGVELAGRRYPGFDARTETIDLPARTGRIQLVARIHRGE